MQKERGERTERGAERVHAAMESERAAAMARIDRVGD